MRIKLKDLHRGDLVAGCCASAAAVAVFALFGAGIVAIPAAALLGFAAAAARHNYMAGLQSRVDRSDGPDWDVELNGVNVGKINDSEYAAIRQQVFDDGHIYFSQLLNCGRVLVRVFDSMLMTVPVLAFWGLLFVGIVSPEACTQALAELRAVTPAGVAKFASFVFTFMMTLGLLSAGLNAALTGARFGFVNRFTEATADHIRRRLRVPAEGEVVLVRWLDGARVVNDERIALRKAG